MNPPQDNQPINAEPRKRTPEEDAAYAQALIKMVNINYAEQHPEQPKGSFLSTKTIIFFVVIIVVTIVGTVALNSVDKTAKSSSPTDKSNKQLLHSVETFNNPSSY